MEGGGARVKPGWTGANRQVEPGGRKGLELCRDKEMRVVSGRKRGGGVREGGCEGGDRALKKTSVPCIR